jgi:transcriptional regulator with XRE-family HTH domain
MRLPRTGKELYNTVQPRAELFKGVIQIAIGIIVIIAFVLQYFFGHGHKQQFGIALSALGLVGYGLAVSAAVELAYTFFTKGPDEALDPLILGVSAFTLIALSEIDPPKLSSTDAIPISLLALAILLLFLARRFLLEVEDEAPDAEAYLAFQLGQAVRRRRTNLKLSEEELAARTGVTQRALANIEAGHTIPTVAVLQLISIGLGAELVIELAAHKSVHQDEPGKLTEKAISRWRRRLPGLVSTADRRRLGGHPG